MLGRYHGTSLVFRYIVAQSGSDVSSLTRSEDILRERGLNQSLGMIYCDNKTREDAGKFQRYCNDGMFIKRYPIYCNLSYSPVY